MNRVEQAVASFQDGLNCSQAVLSAHAERFGLQQDTARRVAAGMGGGMGRMGDTCGAVTGAFMVLGLMHGPVEAGDQQGKETTYAQVREFARQFESRNGSIVCRHLLECDISTPEGLAAARERKLFTTACPKFVRDAAEILEELLPPAGTS